MTRTCGQNTPQPFLWGAAIPAHGTEGRPQGSDWWQWEQRPGRIADGGSAAPGARHAERWREDIALAAKLRLNSLLTGLDWSRIEPQCGVFSSEILDEYEARFAAMRESGIEPLGVLQQAALPAWFAAAGGWERQDAADRFATYAQAVVERLAPYCGWWFPIAEPMYGVTMGYGAGLWPPGKRNVWAGLRAVRHMARAHAAAYRVIKVRQPEALVGPSIRARRFEPDDPYSAADLRVALREEWRSIDIFLEAVTTGRWPGPLPGTDTAACADVAGVAFFGQERVRRNVMRALRLGVERVDAEGNRLERPRPEPNPQAFREVIQRVARRGLPVVVTGNGRAATDDAARQGFLARRAAETGRLRAEGVDLRGYMHYALLDGFEWDLGWSARYGLVHVDRETGARTPNPSAYLYRDIAAYDGLPPAAAQRYGVEEGLDADHRD